MGKIALSQNISLDGVMQLDGEMQLPGPTDVPFKYTGWAVDFGGGPEGARFNYGDEVGLEQAQNSEGLLLGRVTYEAMQAFWPTAEGELADRLNELPKYVVSSTLTDPAWNATVLGDDWREEVARLPRLLRVESRSAASRQAQLRPGRGVGATLDR
jgi:dihydrofolate reductase